MLTSFFGSSAPRRCLVLLVLLAGMPGSPRADILIATAGPFTGSNIFRGEQIRYGAEMAVADINADGGVLGQALSLLVVDDACDPEQAVAVAKKLVADGVVFVAGHVCSHASIPASEIYQRAGIVMISPASTNPRLTDQGGDYIFRICGRDDYQGRIAGDYLADDWGEHNIAILHDGSVYGEGLANETRKQLARRDVVPAIYAEFEPGQRSYTDLIVRLQSESIDVVYVAAYTAETGLMVRQARDRDYQAQFVTGDAVTNEEFWLITGDAGEGTRGTFGPDPRQNTTAAGLVQRYRQAGYEPAGYTLHTYAAVQAWARAAETAGRLDAAAVSQALRQGRFDTALGRIGFDDNGDVTAPGFVWYVWKRGRYVPLH